MSTFFLLQLFTKIKKFAKNAKKYSKLYTIYINLGGVTFFAKSNTLIHFTL